MVAVILLGMLSSLFSEDQYNKFTVALVKSLHMVAVIQQDMLKSLFSQDQYNKFAVRLVKSLSMVATSLAVISVFCRSVQYINSEVGDTQS